MYHATPAPYFFKNYRVPHPNPNPPVLHRKQHQISNNFFS